MLWGMGARVRARAPAAGGGWPEGRRGGGRRWTKGARLGPWPSTERCCWGSVGSCSPAGGGPRPTGRIERRPDGGRRVGGGCRRPRLSAGPPSRRGGPPWPARARGRPLRRPRWSRRFRQPRRFRRPREPWGGPGREIGEATDGWPPLPALLSRAGGPGAPRPGARGRATPARRWPRPGAAPRRGSGSGRRRCGAPLRAGP